MTRFRRDKGGIGPAFFILIPVLITAAACAPKAETVAPASRVEKPAQGGADLPQRPSAEVADRAYEHNRAGMMNMSMARFREAISEFEEAAALVKDYAIQGRHLVYTPVFMTAWAYEKIGDIPRACEHYRSFLDIPPAGVAESSKVSHARDYLKRCPPVQHP